VCLVAIWRPRAQRAKIDRRGKQVYQERMEFVTERRENEKMSAIGGSSRILQGTGNSSRSRSDEHELQIGRKHDLQAHDRAG
jgi:hypothetical protein